MTPTLTDADREAKDAAISAAYAKFESRKHEWGVCRDAVNDAIYLAGLAAGMERGARVCETYAANMRGIKGAGGRDCAADIRAQAKGGA